MFLGDVRSLTIATTLYFESVFDNELYTERIAPEKRTC